MSIKNKNKKISDEEKTRGRNVAQILSLPDFFGEGLSVGELERELPNHDKKNILSNFIKNNTNIKDTKINFIIYENIYKIIKDIDIDEMINNTNSVLYNIILNNNLKNNAMNNNRSIISIIYLMNRHASSIQVDYIYNEKCTFYFQNTGYGCIEEGHYMIDGSKINCAIKHEFKKEGYNGEEKLGINFDYLMKKIILMILKKKKCDTYQNIIKQIKILMVYLHEICSCDDKTLTIRKKIPRKYIKNPKGREFIHGEKNKIDITSQKHINTYYENDILYENITNSNYLNKNNINEEYSTYYLEDIALYKITPDDNVDHEYHYIQNNKYVHVSSKILTYNKIKTRPYLFYYVQLDIFYWTDIQKTQNNIIDFLINKPGNVLHKYIQNFNNIKENELYKKKLLDIINKICHYEYIFKKYINIFDPINNKNRYQFDLQIVGDCVHRALILPYYVQYVDNNKNNKNNKNNDYNDRDNIFRQIYFSVLYEYMIS